MSLKKWILAGGIVLLFLSLAFFLLNPAPPPPIKLPNPNGYDNLVEAGQMFVGNFPPECNWDKLDDDCAEKMRAILKENVKALETARLGLGRESRIPPYSSAQISQHMADLPSLKRLAQALYLEGKVAEKDGRIEDAIQSYLDTVHIHGQLRGGVMIDALVGIAIEGIGINPLKGLADKMAAEQRRELVQNLARAYSDRDSYDEIMRNEKKYVNTRGWRDYITYFTTFHLRRAAERRFRTKLRYARTRVGLMMIDLTLRNFIEETGRPPKTLHDLVPKHLPFLPKDDFSGKDFVYRPLTNSYELYGVGSDGKDDGGKPFVKRGIDSPGDMLPSAQY